MCRVKDVFADKLHDDPTQLIDAIQRTELVGKQFDHLHILWQYGMWIVL